MATEAGPSLAAVLFTDLVGSTALRAALGEERADELRKLHDRMLGERVEAHGGRVVKGTGDGLVAAFASASDALSAAVEMQQAIDRHNRRPDAMAQLSVRIGVSVGDVSWDGGECFGTPMVEAARLEAVAEGGQIVCSDFVRVMARGRGGHRFRALGELTLKGLPEPLAACEVEWERPEEPGAEQLPFPPSLVVHSPLAFVGREEELATAERHLGQTDGLVLLWILGEPGIGKTRLAAELARRAHEAGADVLFGRCDEDLLAPYQPFVDALRHFVTSTAAGQLAERLGRHPAELVRLLPDLAGLVPGLEPAPPSEPEVERYRLFEAVRSWLGAAAVGARPVLLVLDDLHWADRATVQLLAHLARAAEAAPVRVVGALRDTEPWADGLRALLDELVSLPASKTVALRGLGEAGVGRLVEVVTGRSTDAAALARRIHTETAGNPLFVSAMLAGLEPGEDVGELPGDVRAAVRRRTSRLSPSAQELLRVGAVAGLEFDLRVLARVLPTEPAAALDAADEAVRAHLAEEVGVNRYRFAHALVRAALRQEVGASRAAHAHGLIGEALEAVYQDRLDEHADELAYHFGEAVAAGGSIDRALRYTLRAAELAATQYASEAAAQRYRRALELLEGSGRVGDRQHCEVLVALGEAQWHAGDFGEAQETLRRAAAEAGAGDWPELLAEAAVHFEYATTWPGLPGNEAAELLGRAERRLDPADSALHARVLTGLSRALSHTERAQEGAPLLDRAIAMARRVGDNRVLARALDAVVHALIGPEQAERRLVSARETHEVAGRVGDRRTQSYGAANTATSLLELGRITELHAAVEECERLQGELAEPNVAYLLATLSGVVALLEGRLEEAERLAGAARDAGRDLRGIDPEGMYGVQMFGVRREQGRLTEVAPAIRTLVRLGAASPVWRPGLAAIYAELGVTAEARAELENLVTTGGVVLLPADALRGVSLSYLADAAAFVADAERAEVLYRYLQPYAELCVVMYSIACYGPASRYLGMLAATAGRLDDAQAHFDDALERCDAMGSPLWAAHTQYHFARLLLTRRRPGDAAQARLLAGAARETAARIGMAALERRAAQLLEGGGD